MTDLHISCPFCPFADSDGQFVSQHIEYCHPEGADFSLPDPESAPQRPSSADDTEKYVDCPHGCGEIVAAAELDIHLDLHVAEEVALDDSGAVPVRSPAVLEEDFDDLDMLDSYKDGKRGMQRASARANTSKPPRAHSPPRTTNSDGVKRLGVCPTTFI